MEGRKRGTQDACGEQAPHVIACRKVEASPPSHAEPTQRKEKWGEMLDVPMRVKKGEVCQT